MKPAIALILAGTLLAPVTVADQATAMKSGCAGCHQMDRKTVGPSINDIAAKLKGGDVDAIVATVQAGRSAGELQWGTVPMPPNQSPEADIRKVVEWMLSQ